MCVCVCVCVCHFGLCFKKTNPSPSCCFVLQLLCGPGSLHNPILPTCSVLLPLTSQRDATGYFNVLNEEGRVVVGALLALDPDVPLLENLPEQKDPLYDRPFLQQ